jgi:hypothetical protein
MWPEEEINDGGARGRESREEERKERKKKAAMAAPVYREGY